MAESKIKDENYYQISGFMINRLGLKGVALNVYAIIYGFSQDGESEFTGNLQYLCDFCGGVSKPTVIHALKELTESGFITRSEEHKNNLVFPRYRANLTALKNLTGGKEILTGGLKNFNGGSKEILPNNKNNNNIDNEVVVNDDGDELTVFKDRVLLTDNQLADLLEKMGLEVFNEYLARLNDFIVKNNATVKNHYATILKWYNEDRAVNATV